MWLVRLHAQSNPALVSFDGLANVKSAGSVTVAGNALIADLLGLVSLTRATALSVSVSPLARLPHSCLSLFAVVSRSNGSARFWILLNRVSYVLNPRVCFALASQNNAQLPNLRGLNALTRVDGMVSSLFASPILRADSRVFDNPTVDDPEQCGARVS